MSLFYITTALEINKVKRDYIGKFLSQYGHCTVQSLFIRYIIDIDKTNKPIVFY